MLAKILTTARIVAYLAVASAGVAVTCTIIEARPTFHQFAIAAEKTNKVLLEFELTSMEVRKASAEQRKFLPILSKQVSQLVADASSATVEAKLTLTDMREQEGAITRSTVAAIDSLNKSAEALQPAIVAAGDTLKSTNKTVEDLDNLILDPHIRSTLAGFDSTAANTASAMGHIDATAGDVQAAAHAYLHPTWKAKVFGWTVTAVHALGGWF